MKNIIRNRKRNNLRKKKKIEQKSKINTVVNTQPPSTNEAFNSSQQQPNEPGTVNINELFSAELMTSEAPVGTETNTTHSQNSTTNFTNVAEQPIVESLKQQSLNLPNLDEPTISIGSQQQFPSRRDSPTSNSDTDWFTKFAEIINSPHNSSQSENSIKKKDSPSIILVETNVRNYSPLIHLSEFERYHNYKLITV